MILSDALTLSRWVKEEATRLGFSKVGIGEAGALSARRLELQAWLSAGLSGGLSYMESFFARQERLFSFIPDVRSVVVMAAPYACRLSEQPPSEGKGNPGKGRVARYAWGRDYHRAIRKRLKKFEKALRTQAGRDLRCLYCVDSNPLQERALGETVGLGFFGKNTCLISPKGGSFFFLAALLTNLELIPDPPIRRDCGACTLCLQACPTQALIRPYQLDAGRCISSLTIEWKGDIPPELRPNLQDRIFGCDICQEVCPYNRASPGNPWPEFSALNGAGESLSLAEILKIRTEEAFLSKFAGTPLRRAKREGLLRNACVAAGNLLRNLPAQHGGEAASDIRSALQTALREDPSPLVREHAAWALQS